jgi:hypothetical protein
VGTREDQPHEHEVNRSSRGFNDLSSARLLGRATQRCSRK